MSNKVTIELFVDDKGTVHVKKFAGETEKSFKKMERQAEASTTRMGSALQKLKQHWMAVTAAMVGIVLAAKKFVTAASDLEEVNSKFNVVFKDQIDLAEKWAQQLVDSYAMSTRETKQYLSSIQDLLVPMGMAADSAGKMSIKIVKLSADLGSFNNLPTAQVMADIQSGLVGNYETMKKYGVVLNATVVQEKALAMGLAGTKNELTAAHKAHAAYTLMVEGSKAAIGDMARTSGGYANQMKQLNAHVEEFSATIGTLLIPKLSEWAKKLNDVGFYLKQIFGLTESEKAFKKNRATIMEQIDVLEKELIELQEDPVLFRFKWGDRSPADIMSDIDLLEEKLFKVTREYHESLKQGAKTSPPSPPGGPGPAASPATSEYYKEQMEEWKQVTADLYAMKKAAEAADLAHHKATLEEWGQVTADFAEAEQAQWEQETEQFLALEEIKAQAHQEEMQRYDEVMAANEEYMKQYKANEKAKADLAYQTALSMVSWYAAAFKELAKGSDLAFDAAKIFSAMQALMKTHEFAVKAAAWASTWGGLPAGMAAKAVAWAAGIAHVKAIMAMEPAAYYHEGGIVGSGFRPSRMVSPDVFAGAQRAHQGLAPDERPVIVRKDEGIFTPAQMAALGLGRTAGDINMNITLLMNGRPITKEMIHTVEVDGILLNRLRRALS